MSTILAEVHPPLGVHDLDRWRLTVTLESGEVVYTSDRILDPPELDHRRDLAFDPGPRIALSLRATLHLACGDGAAVEEALRQGNAAPLATLELLHGDAATVLLRGALVSGRRPGGSPR